MSGVLRFDQLDTTRQRVIQQNLATLKAKGASDADIESYLRDDEKLAPTTPSVRPDATAVTPRSDSGGLLTNLRDMAIGAIAAPFKSAFDATITPGVGESRPDPRLSKGGNSAGLPLNQPPYDAEHGAVTPTRRFHAATQTAANIAAPAMARLGIVGRLAGEGAVGASYDPEHPIQGAGLGIAAGEALHGAGKALGAGASKAVDLMGRPVSYEGVPRLGTMARDFTNKLLSPLTNDASLGLGDRPQGPVMPDAFGSEVPTLSTRRINGPEPAPQKGQLLKATARALGVQSQEDRITGLLSNAAKASGITSQAASSIPVESPTTALDLAEPGSPLHRLVRQAYNVPTSTAQPTLRTFFGDRSAGAGGRIQASLADETGHLASDTDFPIEARIEQRAAEAKPLYQKAYEYGPIKDPETIQQIQTLLKNPTFNKAWARGKTLMDLDGETGPTTNGEPLSPENAAQLKKMGIELPQTQQGPTVQQIDYWKKGLDAQIESGAGSENALSRTEARAYRQKLSGVLKRVDAEVPAYAEARQNFAGHSDLLEASEAGADHFSPKNSASYLQRTLGERFPTQGEQDAYRANAINSLVQKVRNIAANPDLPTAARGTNIVQRLMGTEDAGAKLRMLFPQGSAGQSAYADFIAKMEQEAQYPKTAAFFQNQSSTAGQLAESKMDPKLWKDIATSPFSTGAKVRLLERALSTDGRMAPETANLIGQKAIQTGPSMQQMVNNRFLRAAKKPGRLTTTVAPIAADSLVSRR